MQTGGVDEGNFAHADDTDLRLLAHRMHDVVELAGDAEEEGPVDFVYLDPLGHLHLVVAVVALGVGRHVDLVVDDRDVGTLHDAAHEHDDGHEQAGGNGDGEVEDYREQQGGE